MNNEIEGLAVSLSDLMTIRAYGLRPKREPVSLLMLCAKHMRMARQISIEALMKAQEESKRIKGE